MDTPNTEEQVTLTKEEYANMQSFEKRYKDSQKEGELLSHVKKTRESNDYLLSLSESNRPMAERVAEIRWLSLEDAIAKIWWGKEEKPNFSKDDLKAEIKAVREQERSEELLSKFIDNKKIKWDFLEDFQSEFDDYMEWKARTPERVKKATRFALSEAKKVSKFAEEYNKLQDPKWSIWNGRDGTSAPAKKSSFATDIKNKKKMRSKLMEKHSLTRKV